MSVFSQYSRRCRKLKEKNLSLLELSLSDLLFFQFTNIEGECTRISFVVITSLLMTRSMTSMLLEVLALVGSGVTVLCLFSCCMPYYDVFFCVCAFPSFHNE